MLADRSLSEAPNYVVLDDRKLRNWLEYKNSFHPNFFLFSIILALSIILDFLLIKNILGWINKNKIASPQPTASIGQAINN